MIRDRNARVKLPRHIFMASADRLAESIADLVHPLLQSDKVENIHRIDWSNILHLLTQVKIQAKYNLPGQFRLYQDKVYDD